MPIGLFLAPYIRRTDTLFAQTHPVRMLIVNTLNDAINADGGSWREVEILGNQAIVKVRASSATLTAIGALNGVTVIPLTHLDDPLSSLTAGQRTSIRNVILNAGYTPTEVNNRFPNIANATIGDVLRFLATRRLKPRYDSGTDTIVLDGLVEQCNSVDDLDSSVT